MIQESTPSPMPAGHKEMCDAISGPAYLQAARALQQLGFTVKDDDNFLHWSDLLMSAPGVNWSDASKLICDYLARAQAAVEKGTEFPTAEDFSKKDCPKSHVRIHRTNAQEIAGFRNKFSSTLPIAPSAEVIGAFLLVLLPVHIASNFPSTQIDEESKSLFTTSNALLSKFFRLLGQISEAIPEHFDEIFTTIKAGCLSHREELSNPIHTKAFWLKLIILRAMDEDFDQEVEDFGKICADKSRAAEMYRAYKAIYLETKDLDYEAARGRVASLFGGDKHAQKKLTTLILGAREDAVCVLEFYLEHPEIQKLMDKVVRHNMAADNKRSALLSITEYYSSKQPFMRDLIEFAASDNRLLPLILEQNNLETLQIKGEKYCRKLLVFLQETRDPLCYLPVLAAIGNEDLARASLMMASVRFSLKDHARKTRVIEALDRASDSELPLQITEESVCQLSGDAARSTSTIPGLQACFGARKRQRESFHDPLLDRAMKGFERNYCGSYFSRLVESAGEQTASVKNACRHLEQYQENQLYQQFLHDPRLRKLYFQVVLLTEEYSKELKERLQIFDSNTTNPKSEAELFRTWIGMKEEEKKHNPGNDFNGGEEQETAQSKFREPQSFKKILLHVPTDRTVFRLEILAKNIPLMDIENIEIMNSNNLSFREKARNLGPDCLVLSFTGSACHSNSNAFVAMLPISRRRNLYKFGTKRELYDLLTFLNTALARQKIARKLLEKN